MQKLTEGHPSKLALIRLHFSSRARVESEPQPGAANPQAGRAGQGRHLAPIAGRRLPRSAGLGPGRGHSVPGVGGPSSPYTCWAKTPPKESGGFSVPHNAENSDGLFPHCHSNHTFFSVSSLLLCVGWCEMDIRFSNTSHKSF